MNLNMSTCNILMFLQNLVGVIGIEGNAIVGAAISHVTIGQLSMELVAGPLEIPRLVASVDLPSSYCCNTYDHA